MHFRATGPGCPCTDGILVGDYFKSVITGQNLPPDPDADTRTSRYYRQYDRMRANWVARPNDLPNTNLMGAFEPGPGPDPLSASTTAPTLAPPATVEPTATPTATPTAAALASTPTAEAPTRSPTPSAALLSGEIGR